MSCLIRNGFALLFVCLAYSGMASWQWTKVHALDNGKRFEATGFSINGKGYVTCGVDTNDNCYNDLWEYDADFNFWTQKANLPATYRRGAFAFELNNKGYLGSGIDDASPSLGTILTDLWMYDPATNTWSIKAPIPSGSFRSAFASCNGKGYVIGGSDTFSGTSSVYEYNPTTNSWQTKNSFPGLPSSSGGRDGGVALSINNKVYFGMGKDDSFFQNDWWEFDPATNNWVQKANYPVTGRIGAFAFTINNMGCVGMGSDGAYNSDTWWYNPASNTWNYTTSFSGAARRSPAYFVIGSAAYMGTGKSGGGSKQDFYRLDASVGIAESTAKPHTINVYPSLVTGDHFHVDAPSENDILKIVVTDMEGRTVKTIDMTGTGVDVEKGDMRQGVYVISVWKGFGLFGYEKITVL
ncbi:MAG: hypothetical protein JST26_15730 [Bacteroidetes bacterium]|nr:hypothetical protein [Bacteroidota bacterium]